MLGEGKHQLIVVAVGAIPVPNGAFGQAFLGAMNDQFRIEILTNAKAIAFGAGAFGVIEGKNSGFQLAERVSAVRAGILIRKQ